MFVFPYGTDAPLYHRPIATIGLIVFCAVVFVLQHTYPDQAESFILEIGGGIHPLQWLTSNFMHSGLGHIVGNMLFLWVFGLIVEGKIGWWKTLLIFVFVGGVENCLTQLLMLGSEPTHALGASTAIFGFMAICLIWAPENCIECSYCLMLAFRIFAGVFEASVKVFAGIYLGLNILFLSLQFYATGQVLSSEYFHLVGAFIGLGIGIVMLRQNMVDCEYWDIYSVWAGLHTMSPEDRQALEDAKPKNLRRKAAEEQKRREFLIDEIRHAIAVKNAVPALMLIKRKKAEFPNWTLPERDMLQLIQLLSEQKKYDESVALMREYGTLYTSKRVAVQFRLTQTLLAMDQVNAALKELARVDFLQMDAKQREYADDLRRVAEKRKAEKRQSGEGLYELAE